jgi:hypothetical protein
MRTYVITANTIEWKIRPPPLGLPLIAIGTPKRLKIPFTISYVMGFETT